MFLLHLMYQWPFESFPLVGDGCLVCLDVRLEHTALWNFVGINGNEGLIVLLE